ncbi:MAG: AI-2E family transporter [Hyphomonadaceae bacterium]|nr:AI-2E family transporter [Hyphomonadaceae bacterium]
MSAAEDGEARASAGENSAIVLAVIASAAAIYLLRDILAPFLLALFLLVVIGGLSRMIRRAWPKTPRPLAMAAAIVVILGAFGAIVWIVAENVADIAADVETYEQRFQGVTASLQRMFGVSLPAGWERFSGELNISAIIGVVAGWLRSAAGTAGLVILYLGFMMASRRSFSRKLLALTGARAGLAEAEAFFERIRGAVESYVWVQTATGIMLGVLSWALMWACGVPQPLFWAFVIFIASYVPIVGGAVGILAPPIFFLAVSGDWRTALLLLVGLQIVQAAIGNIVQPRMQSRSLNIDPIVVLLSLALWGALLGPVGAFLSTPLTVTAMVILAQSRHTLWMAIMLSDDGKPATNGAAKKEAASSVDG